MDEKIGIGSGIHIRTLLRLVVGMNGVDPSLKVMI